MKYWEKYFQGDLSTLSNIYNYYVDDLFSYGMKICPDEFIVKDAIQDVFILLSEKHKLLDPNKNIKAYIFKTFRNRILEEIRTKQQHDILDKLMFNSEEKAENDIELQIIHLEEDARRQKILGDAMSQLSKHQKEAIYLKFTINCPYEQIAEIMNISISSARTLVYRSLKQMKQYISKVIAG